MSVVQRVLTDNRAELETPGADIGSLEKVQPPFVRLTYSQAAEILTSQATQDFMTRGWRLLRSSAAACWRNWSRWSRRKSGAAKRNGSRRKNARRIAELRSELEELEVKIQNNPKTMRSHWLRRFGG